VYDIDFIALTLVLFRVAAAYAHSAPKL